MRKHDKTGRSKGEARHARLYEHMAKTAAWRELSGNAVKAWLDITLFIYNGSNNGKLAISARALGERIGLHYTSAARAIRELENAGLLRCVKASSFSQKKLAAEYRLTHIRDDVTGEAATRDYERRGTVANVVSFPKSATLTADA